jgi:hypothetical protein
MHSFRQFNSRREFDGLKRMLGEAISRGHVEIIPAMNRWQVPVDEQWFREKETGVIYSLMSPEPPTRGGWERINTEDLKTGNQ